MLRCPALPAPVVPVSFSSGTPAELISKAAEPAGSTPDGFAQVLTRSKFERLAGEKRRDRCRKSMQSRNEGIVHETNLKSRPRLKTRCRIRRLRHCAPENGVDEVLFGNEDVFGLGSGVRQFAYRGLALQLILALKIWADNGDRHGQSR
jgi:hypothetical protein